MGRKKFTYEEVKEYIESKGYKLISKEYKGTKEKITLKCPNGHVYDTDFHGFKNKGSRCRKCSDKKRKLTYDYVKKYIESHGYKLISKEYKNANENLEVECPKGHIYDVNYSNFKSGKRCPYCNGKHKYTKEEMLSYFQSEGYEVLSSEYKDTSSRLIVKCNHGHIYDTTFLNFKRGKRCSKCANNKRLDYNYVKKYIESFGEKLLSKNYINNRTKLTIQCEKGHIYHCSFDNFKKGNRCPECKNFKGELKVEEILKEYDIEFKKQYKFKNCKFKRHLPFDFYLPKYNLLIEYDGKQHYEISEYFGGYNGFIDTKIRDTIKNIYCKEHRLDLLRISYKDFKNIENILINKLNLK